MRFVWMGMGFLLVGLPGFGEPLSVAALHPVLADVVRQVGGDRVEVIDLAADAGNLHHFEPRPTDMKRLQRAALILASGKNFEGYLGRLRSSLPDSTVVEVGSSLPSLKVALGGDHDEATCQHAHVDPHWWHSVDLMRRASRIIAKELGKKDAANQEWYIERAAAYGGRLDELKQWAQRELARVPAEQRKLVTAHHAFGYFARDFGFEVIAVAGLNQEQNTAPRDLAATIETIRKSKVRAVFPEKNVSSKSLDSIVRETGVRMGESLVADGNGRGDAAGFEGMIRHNVAVITQALAPPP